MKSDNQKRVCPATAADRGLQVVRTLGSQLVSRKASGGVSWVFGSDVSSEVLKMQPLSKGLHL